ncbi:glucose-6-phosphate isomerase [Roseovarius autotrophicus]|uniref:glucose-6-phosphate isomerase n=1 Tax=Roseovarius autotrophicus TaxID=2824121 RepID=UPI0019DE115F|nr:glucose-6-phosphate isomerase [Roseovarius autotrophicus]MBE0454943.1 glucose-6-phosphate isomerase [Roseovarius sp.]
MKRNMIIGAVAGLTLAGCINTSDNRELTGAALGAGAGLIGAAVFDANAGWTVISTLAGAAAGTLIARNTRTNQCAYSNGDGTYRTVPC